MEELRRTLEPLIANPWARSVAILLLTLAAAKLTDWTVSGLLRGLTKRTKTDLDDRFIHALQRPVFWSVVLFGLHLIVRTLEAPDRLEVNLGRIFQTVAILLWTVAGGRIVVLVFEALSLVKGRFPALEDGVLRLLTNLSKATLWAAAAYFFFLTWDLNISGWLASAGIVGIAVGFAARDTLANLFAGVFILADRPYKVGDYVNLSSGERGMVTDIGLRTTRLLTRDDVEVTVPNSVMGQETIANEAGGRWQKMRIRLSVGVAYGSDIDEVQETLLAVANAHDKVCAEPEPRVRFRAFGESSLDFELLCWVDEPALRGLVLHELHCSVYKAFAERSITIPFPQRDVHLQRPPEPSTG